MEWDTYFHIQEKIETYEGKIKALNKSRSDIKANIREIERARTLLEENERTILTLKTETQKLNVELRTNQTSIDSETSRFENRITLLEEDKKMLGKDIDNLRQALRVKNKMLEDQNDTIKTLKQTLDVKVREYQGISERDSKIEQQLSQESRSNQEMRHEVNCFCGSFIRY